MKKNTDFLYISFYLLAITISLFILQNFWFSGIFDKINFTNWDAEHYKYIKEYGYKDFRVAFFPFFPIFWRYLAVNEYFISIINALIFLSSFYFIIKHWKISNPLEILLYLSIPSFIFFYFPYTESLFFIFSVIILYGIKNNKINLVFIGLFLSTLTRPSFTVFLPALIILELFDNNNSGKFKRITIYTAIVLLGLGLVGLIQYMDTGEWFKFFSSQKFWGNKLQVPKLHLNSWSGNFITRLDAFTLLFSCLAGGFLFIKLLNLKLVKNISAPREVLFSLAYIGGITLSVLLYRGGSLFSLNRFVFTTPFIILVLNYWLKFEVKFTFKQIAIFFLIISIFWLLFGSYQHIQSVLIYSLLTLYFLLLFLIKFENKLVSKISIILLISLNFIFQNILFVRFLSGLWVA